MDGSAKPNLISTCVAGNRLANQTRSENDAGNRKQGDVGPKMYRKDFSGSITQAAVVHHTLQYKHFDISSRLGIVLVVSDQ